MSGCCRVCAEFSAIALHTTGYTKQDSNGMQGPWPIGANFVFSRLPGLDPGSRFSFAVPSNLSVSAPKKRDPGSSPGGRYCYVSAYGPLPLVFHPMSGTQQRSTIPDQVRDDDWERGGKYDEGIARISARIRRHTSPRDITSADRGTHIAGCTKQDSNGMQGQWPLPAGGKKKAGRIAPPGPSDHKLQNPAPNVRNHWRGAIG